MYAWDYQQAIARSGWKAKKNDTKRALNCLRERGKYLKKCSYLGRKENGRRRGQAPPLRLVMVFGFGELEIAHHCAYRLVLLQSDHSSKTMEHLFGLT